MESSYSLPVAASLPRFRLAQDPLRSSGPSAARSSSSPPTHHPLRGTRRPAPRPPTARLQHHLPATTPNLILKRSIRRRWRSPSPRRASPIRGSGSDEDLRVSAVPSAVSCTARANHRIRGHGATRQPGEPRRKSPDSRRAGSPEGLGCTARTPGSARHWDQQRQDEHHECRGHEEHSADNAAVRRLRPRRAGTTGPGAASAVDRADRVAPTGGARS